MDAECPGHCVLAIVGSRILDGHPEVKHILAEVFDGHNPRHFVSGGAVGIDKMAEDEADRREMRHSKTIHLPERKSWYYYKKRDQLIADDSECLVRIYAGWATTWGSGFTAKEAERQGKRVWRIKVGDGPAKP